MYRSHGEFIVLEFSLFYHTTMLNLQEAERASLIRMLNLSVGDSSGRYSSSCNLAIPQRCSGGRVTDPLSEASTQWKVLVYDKSGKDVIAPLLKIGNCSCSIVRNL